MDKPKINNLIAKVQGRDLTLKQCADATRELNKMMLYTEELEQLILSGVSQQRELLKVLEYTRQIKNNPKDIQLIVDKLYVENL